MALKDLAGSSQGLGAQSESHLGSLLPGGFGSRCLSLSGHQGAEEAHSE